MVHDPFAGGGSIPLEAQRPGLRAIATGLHPVAVMINKALIEIPPKVAGRAPVGPGLFDQGWSAASGLAEDVRRHGSWMREQAHRRIGHLYPELRITEEMAEGRPDLAPYVGQGRTVIAWLWALRARTVKCPNPAFRQEEERKRKEAAGVAPTGDDSTPPGSGDPTPAPAPSTSGTGPSPAPPPVAGPNKPRAFVGSVKLSGLRVGKSAGRIADELLSHPAALPRAEVEVTLEINVRSPEGAATTWSASSARMRTP